VSAYQTEYSAVWPGPARTFAIDPTRDKEDFFNQFDALIKTLDGMGCPKSLRPTVEVRALSWTEWMSYGTAQNRNLI
jgi:hypothetical protein